MSGPLPLPDHGPGNRVAEEASFRQGLAAQPESPGGQMEPGGPPSPPPALPAKGRPEPGESCPRARLPPTTPGGESLAFAEHLLRASPSHAITSRGEDS